MLERGAALGLPLLAGAACTADETPPVVVEGHFEDELSVVLRFSEPLAPVDGIEAAIHFRLGSGFYDDASAQTVYYDLAHHFPKGVPGVVGALADEAPRHGLTLVSRVERGDADDELRLSLSYPLEPYVCDVLVEAEALGIPSGIHLHYAEASFPRVTDLAGNALADLGGWWVSSTFSTTQPGVFPELESRLLIPCPEL